LQAGVNQPQSCGSLITDQKGKATKERDTERQSERKKERRDYTVGGESPTTVHTFCIWN
jgi:hypothetical protein